MPTPTELKKAFVAAGFEIYRTRGDVVHLAERVRENLLMDSGVLIEASTTKVSFLVRAQRSDFPNDAEERLFERATSLAHGAVERGYREANREVRRVMDPGNGERTIDVWCEVLYEKPTPDLEAAITEARYALGIEKAAARTAS